MLKSELEKKYQNMVKIATNLEQLKNVYKDKCEILEQYNEYLKQQIEDLRFLLANKDASLN